MIPVVASTRVSLTAVRRSDSVSTDRLCLVSNTDDTAVETMQWMVANPNNTLLHTTGEIFNMGCNSVTFST